MRQRNRLIANVAVMLLTATAAGVATGETREAVLEELSQFEQPALWFGDKAPPLTIDSWVKGQPVRDFESGRVYVVEFWATWCSPCIKAFPHLSELQERYADNLTVIGVNTWERLETQELIRERIAAFVDRQGKRMRYTVAIDTGEQTSDDWLAAANQTGIPCTFIIDQQGRLAWIGLPDNMDAPLQQILEGTYSIQDYADGVAAATVGEMALARTLRELESGDRETGFLMADVLLNDLPQAGLWTRHRLVQTLARSEKIDVDEEWLIDAATSLCEETKGQFSIMFDTLAAAYFASGDVDSAIEAQNRALRDETDQRAIGWYQMHLAEYEAASARDEAE